jgi:uncharacterized UBP type Zn finger protein
MKTELEKFEEKYQAVTESGCWIWMAALWSQDRYGCFGSRGKMESAHKVSLRLYKGIDAPPNISVCHTCDVSLCVNPEHLFVGTHTDNMRDMVKKGRHKNPKQKLSSEDLEKARTMRREGMQVKQIAQHFGMDRGHMSTLLKGCLPKGTVVK